MKTRFAFVVALLAPLAAAAQSSFNVSFDSFGPVRVGMSKADVSRALGQELERTKQPGDEECEYLHVTNKWEGIEFMFSQGRLVRIDVMKGSTVTQVGIGIGDSISKVRKAYPKRLAVEPHKYIPLPDGKYVTVKAPDGKHAIRFEIDMGRVITYYSGRFPEVEYVEHCL